jgi:hypothetical protein
MAGVPGYAQVREYTDPNRRNNPTLLYTWRKDLSKLICQPCSNAYGGPRTLVDTGCTKKSCLVQKQAADKELAQQSARVQPQLPLLTNTTQSDKTTKHIDVPPTDQTRSIKDKQNRKHPTPKQKKTAQRPQHTHTTNETRQVRVLHGTSVTDRHNQAPKQTPEVWYYVPYNPSDKNKTKRKGWYLYPQTDQPGHYYIGPEDHIQEHKKKDMTHDITVYNNFPFTKTIQIYTDTNQEVPNTTTCITTRLFTDDENYQATQGLHRRKRGRT